MIKEIPKYERPREKLISNGVEALSNIELLAVILKNGTKGKSVLELAEEILYGINSLKDLKNLELEELKKIHGIGDVKAMEILCAIELGRRISIEKNKKIKLRNASDIYQAFKDELDYDKEHFITLYMDIKCNLICKKELYIGTSNRIETNPMDILKYAIKIGCQSIIILHNHPSGDPTPSKADILFTNEINELSKMLKIVLLDHVIIGDTYYSFNENNKL